MAKPSRDAEFTDYVTARSPWLRRVAYLLCGDWHRADDLVQTCITKLYVNWSKASHVDNLDGYARRVLVNTYLAEQRVGWSRFTTLHHAEPDSLTADVDVDASLDLRSALEKLPPRQRATVVLRYYCDLTVDQTAQVMGCSAGNVKSQSSRGLATLRHLLDPSFIPALEGTRS
jgi:RNA polymerase sigma-70 factor (sigma-E family)